MSVILIFLLLLLAPAIPVATYYLGRRTARRGKRALICNIAVFAVAVTLASAYMFSGRAFAADEAAGISDMAQAAAFLGAALVTGMGCIGTGIAVGPAATAAIGAISENEKIMSKALIFVAMAEGIAIYGLLISFMILGRV